MSRIRIYPYHRYSESAKVLAQALGGKRLRIENSRYRYRSSDLLINWGSTTCPYPNALNNASAVTNAADKIITLRRFNNSSVPCPDWTTHKWEAELWVQEGSKVMCRTLTRANSGRGIVVAESQDDLVDAPLYTRYIPRNQEYRVHVVQGGVIDVQRKMRNRSVADEDVNWTVRNHSNGFIFGREGVELPDHAEGMAIAAVDSLGLDFGAVDLVYRERNDTYSVLEVNTAPGLTGTTLEKYVNAF